MGPTPRFVRKEAYIEFKDWFLKEGLLREI
jgi:hypothetical protein